MRSGEVVGPTDFMWPDVFKETLLSSPAQTNLPK